VRRLHRGWLRAVVLAVCLLLAAAPSLAATSQPAHAPAEAAGHAEADAPHGESLLAFLARIANFVILAGGLYYLLKSPLGNYLSARSEQIRSDLVHAAQTREEASARLGAIEARLEALPGEIDALKARGKEEIAAEEARIKQAAEAERVRLVDQTRREIERQLQIARRDLTAHAADLAVGVARARLAHEITDEQQARLIDRYVSQVGTTHE
jgi:F-type H+-transporting ATPase subunit b